MTSTDQTQEDTAAVPGPDPAADAQTAEPLAAEGVDEAPVQAERVEVQAATEGSAELQAAAEAPAEANAPTPSKPDLSPEATGARLSELFPSLFVGPNGNGTWKPIKLKIHADIQARAPGQFSKRALGIFFSRYTTTTAYLRALAAPGAQRHDLDGQPAGEIAEEHRTAAAEEVARRQAIVAERRAAQREAHLKAQREARQATAERSKAQASPDERAQRPPRERAQHDAPRPAGPAARASRPMPQRPPRPASPLPRGAPIHSPPPQRTPAPQAAPNFTAPPMDEDPARRERAALLRAFEASTLAKSNFCVLKRIDEKALDEALELARKERADRGVPMPVPPRRG